MAFEQWGFFSVPHLLCHGATVYNGISEDPWHSHRAFGNGAVTTCFYNLGLSRPGFEHPTFRMRSESSTRLRYCRGSLPIRIRNKTQNNQSICYNNVRPEFRQCHFEQLTPSKWSSAISTITYEVVHSVPVLAIDCLFIGVQLYRQWQSNHK